MYVIIGAGGHSRVIKDTLTALGEEVKGFLDDNPNLSSIDNLPVLGDIKYAAELNSMYTNIKFVLGIGSNPIRRRVEEGLRPYNLSYGKVVHPTAIIAYNVTIGEGTVIMANSVIQNAAKIGGHSIINSSAIVEHDCYVGSFSHVSPNVTLTGGVHVKEGVHIGAGSTAIPGTEIGDWTVIGAGSTIINDIPSKVMAIGTPAKVYKTL